MLADWLRRGAIEIVDGCVWNPRNLLGIRRTAWLRRRNSAYSLHPLNTPRLAEYTRASG